MAINLTFKGLTGVRGTLTGFDETKVISELIEAIATAEGLPTDYYTISKEGDPTNTNSSTVDDSSTTVDSAGIDTGDVIICTPNTSGRDKDQRQIQKLEIAQLKRKGTFRDTVAYPNADDAPYYKPNNTYDLTSLPDVIMAIFQERMTIQTQADYFQKDLGSQWVLLRLQQVLLNQ